MPPITSQLQSALEGRVLSPVFIAAFDIESDPLYVWTGPGLFAPEATGDALLDGFQFWPVTGILNISDAIEDTGSGAAMTITAAAADIDEPLLRQIIRDQRVWHMRRATVWLGLLDDDDMTVIPNPVRLKTGVIKDIQLPAAAGASNSGVVTLTIDVDQGGAVGRAMRFADHPALWDGEDTLGNYVQKLTNRPAGLQGSHDVANTGAIPDLRGVGRIFF